jgi:hypothetical protein
VICIGGGAGGNNGAVGRGGGGGGGARAISYNLTFTPGSTVSFQIGAGGSSSTNGGDTSFDSGAIIAKGGSTGSNGTGGAGGSAGASTGTTKYSGGNGGNANYSPGFIGDGGGGGGAAGDAGNGSNGTSTTGGAGGINDGGDGGAVLSAGWPGFNLGDAAVTAYGSNFAGGGGGAGQDGPGGKGGEEYYDGGAGGLYGGGGGGGGVDQLDTGALGGVGAAGVIIISWNWEGKIKASGQLSIGEIKATLDENFANASLNETSMRDLAGIPSGQIAISNFYSKTPNATFIASSTSSRTVVPSTTTTTFPAGSLVGDMCILAVVHYNQETFINQDGWFYVGKALAMSSLIRLNVYYRILQAGDTAPSFTTAPHAWQMLLFRKASRLTNKWVTNNANAGGSTLDLTGFTKISDTRRIVSIVADSRFNSPPGPTPPAGWAVHERSGYFGIGYGEITSASVHSSSYTNGSTVTWTQFGTGYSQGGILFELE